MEQEHTTYCGCLYYSANALSRVITKMAEEEFAAVGLAPSYAFVLMGVNKKPGIQPKEISEYMQLTPSTVTRLVEKLEYKGMVTRKTQGRATEVYPTPKSLALDAQIREAWRSLYLRYTGIMGEAPAQQLTADIYAAALKLDE
mgnify:CR=1 FL=1